ncbi:hypothetical protein EYF80_008076 [Liparis tanakae]|uniref:Uncharacterized protein n=1 Tax=Liparis tanakae TaxID=230148 RepID=A0A4Z2IUG5_9TELE|nr:hypothetical protein EYF80_008076 [Liparis tanakae]
MENLEKSGNFKMALPSPANGATARATATPSSTSLFSVTSRRGYPIQSDALTVVVMWPLKVNNSHCSFKSSEGASLIFDACVESKLSYLLIVAPSLQESRYQRVEGPILNHYLQSNRCICT